MSIRFHEDAELNAKKVARLLPVLTDLFTVMPDNSIKVTVGNLDEKRQRIILQNISREVCQLLLMWCLHISMPDGGLED